MKPVTIAGVLLIVLGLAALAIGFVVALSLKETAPSRTRVQAGAVALD